MTPMISCVGTQFADDRYLKVGLLIILCHFLIKSFYFCSASIFLWQKSCITCLAYLPFASLKHIPERLFFVAEGAILGDNLLDL